MSDVDLIAAAGTYQRELEAAQEVAGGPSPEAALEARQRVEQANACLSQAQWIVMLLVHRHGLTQRAVAKKTGHPLTAVEDHYREACAKLAAHYQARA